MKQLFLVLTFLFCVSHYNSVAQVLDSASGVTVAPADTSALKTAKALTEKGYDDSNDFDPGLLLIGLTGLGLIIVSVGVGIVVIILVLFLLFMFVSVGVLSTSIIVGLHKKSFEKGFKIFIISSSTLAGTLLFTVVFWAINHIMHWFKTQTALLMGAGFGLFSGLILGLLVFYVLKKLSDYLKGKLHLF